jgi:hypothetical protein
VNVVNALQKIPFFQWNFPGDSGPPSEFIKYGNKYQYHIFASFHIIELNP